MGIRAATVREQSADDRECYNARSLTRAALNVAGISLFHDLCTKDGVPPMLAGKSSLTAIFSIQYY
jgi:hypothetical protein